MTREQFLASRPDLVNNWNNAQQYMQNPNDPRWASDPNVAGIASFGSLDNYLQASYGAQPFDGEQPVNNPPPATNNPPANSGSTSWGDLINNSNPTPPAVSQTSVAQPSSGGGGGNYNQVQNANQAGQFATTGNTVQQQQQTSGQTGTTSTATNQQQQQSTTGGQSQQTQQTGTTTGTQQTSGTETTTGRDVQNIDQTTVQQALDSLGFGQLLKDQAGQVQQSDAARSTFLQDVMNTGGTGFQSQMDQAIRQSLTGPQTTGSGESARARMASYGAAEVGRTNMNQRLAAADQLAGTTGLANLSTAANPYIGSTSNTKGTNTTDVNRTSNTTGTSSSTQNQNTLGSMTGSNWQNLVGSMTGGQTSTSAQTGWQNLFGQTSESQAGSTSAASSQAGSGLIPQGQPVKTGGCVLCTAAIELGYEKNLRVLRKVIAYKLGPGWKKFRLAARGYFAVFGPFADWLLDHPKTAKILYPLARKVVYEELRVAGRKLPFRLDAFLVHWTGDVFCRLVGLLPVPGYVKQSRILDIAKRYNILFNVEGS